MSSTATSTASSTPESSGARAPRNNVAHVSRSSPTEFGAKRALVDGPDSSEPILELLNFLVRAVMAKPLVDLDTKMIVLRRTNIPFDLIDVAKLEVGTDIGGR